MFFRKFLPIFLFVFFSAPLPAKVESRESFHTTTIAEHRIEILESGFYSLLKRLRMIQRAKKRIDMEYYIFQSDLSGYLVLQALIEKARHGVRVRILLDDASKLFIRNPLSPFTANYLKNHHGIEVKYYNTNIANLHEYQRRNHRKLISIDESEIMIGGRNIGDDYFDIDPSYNYLDRDIWVKGPIVKDVAKTIDIMWNAPQSKPISPPSHPLGVFCDDENEPFCHRLVQEWKKGKMDSARFIRGEFLTGKRRIIVDALKKLDDMGLSRGVACNRLSFISDIPGIGLANGSTVGSEVLKRIYRSKDEVWIESPYFIVKRQNQKKFKHWLARGEKTYLLTNTLHSTDNLIATANFYSHLEGFIRSGLKVSLFDGSLPDGYPLSVTQQWNGRWGGHAKSIVFDDDSAMIGTNNFDPRSVDLNFEMAVFCDDSPGFRNALLEKMKSRLSSTYSVTTTQQIRNSYRKDTSLLKILAFHFLRFPSLLFEHLL